VPLALHDSLNFRAETGDPAGRNAWSGSTRRLCEAAKAEDTLCANIEHCAPMLHDLLFGTHLRVAGAPVMATAEQMQQLEDSPAFFRTCQKDRALKPLAPVKLQKDLIEYGIFDP
jgi:hypothetical protein